MLEERVQARDDGTEWGEQLVYRLELRDGAADTTRAEHLKAQATTTWPRCAPRSSGVGVFSHSEMRQGDASAG